MNIKNKINLILAEWDPIELGHELSLTEYKKYVPIIYETLIKNGNIMICMEKILIDQFGLEFNRENNEQMNIKNFTSLLSKNC